MEQAKALNALEPFVALSKLATSPRAAADLVTRATSASNTFLFTELLQTSQIQDLANSPEFAPHLSLLKIFSYGTYKSYNSATDLPPLNEAQTLKLRQLSLLSLASDRASLSYDALQSALNLASPREVEDLVITAVYAGLLHAKLDPARQAVEVTGIAPLRDLAPASLPTMISALSNWSDRCTATLADLEAQTEAIRDAAVRREREAKAAEEKTRQLIMEVKDSEKKFDGAFVHDTALARRGLNKRSMLDSPTSATDSMDLDDLYSGEEKSKRASKRKM